MTPASDRLVWELAQRPLIENVMLDYCDAVDLNDVERLVTEVFTADGRFELGSRNARQGTEQLRDMFTKTLDQFQATSHHLTNVRIELTGDDTAEASGSVYAWHALEPDGRRVELWGRYQDTLRYENGAWRIAVRRLTSAGEDNWDDAPFERIPRLSR